jgi:hypothetical protein
MLIPLETPPNYSLAKAAVASVNCAWSLLSRLQGSLSSRELLQALKRKEMTSVSV